MPRSKYEARWVHKGAKQKHFRARIKERFGVDLDVAEWSGMLQSIIQENAEFLGRPSLRTSFWRLDFRGEPLIVVFDHEVLEMVTVLTEQMWEQRRWQ
jgi:hypothetical protein